ncbi:energy transducer TonB [Sulfitobacter sp. HNIBRBA3233]|uniref:energy transducer TonB n=1 Tax=Sulfitobacter marinivivus TaxID=3158558 RepID=UPI0032DE5C9F
MSLTYTSRSAMPLFWCAAILLSGALHAGVPLLVMGRAPQADPADAKAEGVTGAMLFDLSDTIAAPAALEENSVAQDAAQEAPTVTESPEPVDAAQASEQPVLSQIPYEVEDDSLKFGVAAPEPEAETEKTAEDIATEQDPEQEHVDSQVGAQDRQASEQSIAGPRADAQADTAQAESEGLTAEQTEEIRAWQKSIVLLISKAKTYPPQARSDRIEGEVQVKFTVDRYGALISTEVAKSSGSEILDRAALRTVEGLEKMPTPPNYLAGDAFALIIPLRYSFR